MTREELKSEAEQLETLFEEKWPEAMETLREHRPDLYEWYASIGEQAQKLEQEAQPTRLEIPIESIVPRSEQDSPLARAGGKAPRRRRWQRRK